MSTTNTYKIKGMHCASCASIIERTVKKIDGVEDISVNNGTENAKISFNTEKTSPEIFNQKLDINDKKIFSEITTPVTITSRINELSRSQSVYRNEYILDQIEKYWNDEYNIFIIYGAGHAVMQEPAIRSLIN